MHIFLRMAARWFALLGAAVGLCVGLVTVVSVLGRATVSRPIFGDVEITQVGMALCISLCLPWCQLKRGNIIVDFFTTGASEAARARMDRLGALLLAAVMALMSWRSVLGGLNAWTTQSGSMMLGFPEWVVYAFMVPPMTLTAVIALHQALFGFAQDDTEENPELAV